MDPNGKSFQEKIEFPRSILERAEQGRAIKYIGLGWIEHSKDNQRREEGLNKRKERILDRIG